MGQAIETPASIPLEAVQHLEQACELESRGDLGKAIRSCQAALALAPDWAEAHNLYGILLERLGLFEEAVAAYRRAVQLDPAYSGYQDNLLAAERGLQRAWVKEQRLRFRNAPALAPGEDLATAATFSYPIEAHLARTMLEWNGIECYIADEYVIQLNWLLSNAIGRVKLRVKSSDWELAREVLQQPPIDESWLEEQADPSDPRCPKCASRDVHFERLALRSVFISWVLMGPAVMLIYLVVFTISVLPLASDVLTWVVGLIIQTPLVLLESVGGGFPLPLFKNRWKCARCGYEWRNQKV